MLRTGTRLVYVVPGVIGGTDAVQEQGGNYCTYRTGRNNEELRGTREAAQPSPDTYRIRYCTVRDYGYRTTMRMRNGRKPPY